MKTDSFLVQVLIITAASLLSTLLIREIDRVSAQPEA